MKRAVIGLVSGGFLLVALSALAATYTNANMGGYAVPSFQARTYMLSKEVDLSVQNVTTGDVVQVFAIPSNTFVRKVVYKVELGGTNDNLTAPTFSIGDGSNATGYQGAGTAAYPIGAHTECDGVNYLSGHFYGANDTIDTTWGAPGTIGKVRFWVECVDFNDLQ